ncbi:hypothetical protein PG637_03610 [Riemerella anatipestifer]|nr:hypothetical protein [Riemerella anatipestifer]MDY3324759.1 hypothetical protein [Riemerella anatipestifer]MDY3353569.1 hypothetical protein [Riemerella anatipestifer]
MVENKRKQYLKRYFGIFLGVLYGVMFRLLSIDMDIYDFNGVTFLVIIPIILSIIPITFSSTEIYKSKLKLFFYPFFTHILFFIVTFVTGLEDLLCILILGIPYFVIAGIVGLLAGFLIRDINNYNPNKKIYFILIFPFITSPIEHIFPNKSERFLVEENIIINKNYKKVWENILAVPKIKEEEYKNGIFQYIGIPRPICSVVYNNDKVKRYRVGYFTGGLELYEEIKKEEKYTFVQFEIDISKSRLRDTPTDKHILNNEELFKFETISYRLEPISENRTKLVLNCEYQLNSKMNFYAQFWADKIILDFEKRLLSVLKLKLEE